MYIAAPDRTLGEQEWRRANPRAMLSVAGDWAFIPSEWKAIGGEDPALGIPTTYYAAVQLKGHAEIRDVDRSHREMVIGRLRARRAAGDLAAAQHTERRLAGLYQG
jgi:transcriptional regulator